MILIIAVLIGIFAGLVVPYNLDAVSLPYVAVAIIAALDSVFGGFNAYIGRRFNIYMFMSGFFANAFLAMLLAYVGNLLGINLVLVPIIVFGTRIFNNAATVRHTLLSKYFAYKDRKNREALIAIEGERLRDEGED